MKEFELALDQKSTTWTVYRCATFTVTVSHWTSPDYDYFEGNSEVRGVKNHWNVYANIFDNHPAFHKADDIKDSLPFHGGCTYDQRIIHEPLAFKYDWHKRQEAVKLGSDYSHIYDNKDHVSAEGGIPRDIKADAEELVNALLN